MFQLGFLLFSLNLACAVIGSEVDKYVGDIIPVAMFSNLQSIPLACQWITLETRRNKTTCSCGDRIGLQRYALNHAKADITQEFVPIVVNSLSEAAAAVDTQGCMCGDQHLTRMVLKPINDNYFVQYEVAYPTLEDNAPNTAILFLKKAPKMSDLENFIRTVEDLADRSYDLICDSAFFVSED